MSPRDRAPGFQRRGGALAIVQPMTDSEAETLGGGAARNAGEPARAAAAASFSSARPRRAFDLIISQVREMLQSGQLKPGDRLPPERVLAEQMEVSRNTVREAIRMLEISGLVTVRPGSGGGAFVARPDSAIVARQLSDALNLTDVSLADITEARLWLETTVVRVACERMTPEYLAALEANVALAEELTAGEDWGHRAEVHIEFHKILVGATQNPLFIFLMNSVLELLPPIIAAVGPSRDSTVMQSRRRLMDKLRERDADGAAAEMERHLRRLHQRWLTGSYDGSRRG